MAEEQKTDAEVKPAKTRTPRKRTPKAATPAAGEAGAATPAPAAETPAKKKPAPRKKADKKPAAAPEATSAPAPAPQQQEQPKQEKHDHQPKQEKREERRPRHEKGHQQNAAKPAENANAKPLNTSEERADSTSEERPLVRNIEQSAPKPTSVPGFATPETVGGEGGNGGNGRRKRRRNRNRRGGEERQPLQNGPSPRVDADELYRRAWKIFLGEVTEEGLALMDDRTAQEASRRAFRVAELFLLEAARHKPTAADAPVESADDSDEEEGPEETEA